MPLVAATPRRPSCWYAQRTPGVPGVAARTVASAAASHQDYRPWRQRSSAEAIRVCPLRGSGPVVAWEPRGHRLGGATDGAAMDDGGVGLLARSTARPYRSRPWVQQRGADGAEIHDGPDDPCLVWQGRRAPWYPSAEAGGRSTSASCGVRRGRSAWCRLPVSTPVCGASRSHAWRGKERS